MDHNPFISRNNDLFIMTIIGFGTLILNQYFVSLTVQAQFLMIFTVGFLGGLFMNFLYQSLEWALFFALGVLLATLTPYIIGFAQGAALPLAEIYMLLLETGHYSLFLLSSWIVAIPAGLILQRLIMGNYYRQTLF